MLIFSTYMSIHHFYIIIMLTYHLFVTILYYYILCWCDVLIDKKVEGPTTLLSKLGLDDWKFALPIGMLVGIPAVANEVIVLDAEFQLTACFILFLSTMYTQVGPMVGKALDDYGNEVQNELKELDKTLQGQITAAMTVDEEALTLKEDFQNLFGLTDQLAMAQAEVLTNIEAHKYHEAIVKKLDSLHALEEAATTAIRNRVITNVQQTVVQTFKSDKKAQESALNQAIAVLAAGAGGKLGKDVVGEAFVASIAAYKANYAKQPAGSDTILAQLQKDMAAVATAPEVTEEGGNVFLTNPVL